MAALADDLRHDRKVTRRPPARVGRRVRCLRACGVGLVPRGATPAVARCDTRIARSGDPTISGNGAPLAIVPDGSRFVYVASDGDLCVWGLGQLRSSALPSGGVASFHSPDGEWIGYADGSTLEKVALTSESQLTITSVSRLSRGASWGENGTIVFTSDVASPLQGISRPARSPRAGDTVPKPREAEPDV